MKIIDNELLDALVKVVSEKQVEISVDITPDQCNMNIQPWRPFHYSCPYEKMEDDLK